MLMYFTIILAILIGIFDFCAMQSYADSTKSGQISKINADFIVKPHEAHRWHLIKDSFGPTLAGTRSWSRYLAFLEAKLKEYGVVDIIKNQWAFTHWETSEWPDDSGWGLTSDGKIIKVAHYGAYSGSTTPEGVTANLVLYDQASPAPSIDGKIVVFQTKPFPRPPYEQDFLEWFTLNDYEYMTSPETFPPLFTFVSPRETVSYDQWWQLRQHLTISPILKKGKVAGGVIVFNMGYDRLAGLYTFPLYLKLPWPLGVPLLFVDREAGKKLIEDARKGKTANLKLVARTERKETYQLIGYLPGKNYGTSADEKILLISHTDGPAISQENGALGILGIVHYFSQIPQAERSRTLMIYLDCRHYMPTMEPGFSKEDFFSRNPEAKKDVVAIIGIEHLGQVEYREVGEVFEPTGKIEPTFLWVRNNQTLIDMAVKTVKEHHLPRCLVQCVERPGVHGKQQGVWYGLGMVAMKLLGREKGEKTPAFSMMGTQGAYWATTARIDKFDRNHFCRQLAVMIQLTGELMRADLEKIRPTFAKGPGVTHLFR